MDPKNDKEFVSKEALEYFGKVDWYNGGMEHTARHLLYARFWNQFLYNIGLVPNKEPIDVRVSHGMILGPNGEKMSKSKGNVINPDDIVGLKGCKKFLDRIWKIQEKLNDKDGYTNETLVHQTIKKVSNDLENMKYNTAVSTLMIFLNDLEKYDSITKDDLRVLVHLLNPIAPHITEEVNEHSSLGKSLCESTWPKYDEAKTVNSSFEMVIQVNGKVRGKVTMGVDASKEQMESTAMENENVKKFISGKNIVNVVVIPKRLVNIVVK